MSGPPSTLGLPPATLESSQPTQEETAARLPTPSQAKLCEPCKAFLRGDRTEYFGEDTHPLYSEYVHHPDAKSFQEALELPCDICIRLYKAFRRDDAVMSLSYSAQRTMYSLRPSSDEHSNHNTKRTIFSFISFGQGAELVPEPYESRPDLHHQHITSNTGDAIALSFFTKQFRKCRMQHEKCQHLAPYNNFMPTRVIYVGSAEDKAVRLCDRVDTTTGSAYCVLSHCWGIIPQQVMLMSSTVDMLKEGIPWSSLPKTFQDAILVTRRFKIQYIWIDSLCIFQDDLSDWAMEANHMRDIYSKADFCIAATAASSGDVGLFFDRDIQELTPVALEATWSNTQDLSGWPVPGIYLFRSYSGDPTFNINYFPLNRRAWVAQERFLSSRILHFTKPLLVWECHSSFTNENYTKTDYDPSFMSTDARPDLLKRLINGIKWPVSGVGSMLGSTLHSDSNDMELTTLRKIYQSWCRFLSHYSECSLTKESDILVAIVGIADEVGHAMSDCLVAGLWKGHFIEEMCWLPSNKSRRPILWRAPSWSWAGIVGHISPSSTWYQDPPYSMATVVELCISTKPSGEVEPGASVLLECRPIPASLRLGGEIRRNARFTLNKASWPSLTEEPIDGVFNAGICVHVDIPDAPGYEAQKVVDVQLLVLLRSGPRDSLESLRGICVVDSGSRAGAFERIGYFDVFNEDAISVLAAYDQARVQTVVLV